MANKVCNTISAKVCFPDFDSSCTTLSSNSLAQRNYNIPKNAFTKISFKIIYNDGSRVDGPFSISFSDIYIVFASNPG